MNTRRSRALCSFLAGLFCSLVCAAQAVDVAAQKPWQPRPMQPREVESWMKRHDVSAVQAEAILALHAIYLRAWEEATTEATSEYAESFENMRWEMCRLYPHSNNKPKPELAHLTLGELARECFSREADLRRAVETTDEAFMEEALVVLGDDAGPPALARLRRERVRALYPPDDSELPYGRVDLVTLLERLEPALPATASTDLRAWRDRYEPIFAEALRESRLMLRKFYSNLYDVHQLTFEYQDNPPAPEETAAIIAHVHRLYDEIGKLADRTGRRLRDINREGLMTLEPLLSASEFARVRARFLETAYPTVHPDPVAAGALFDAALALEDLPAATRELVGFQRDEWEGRHALLSSSMEQALDELSMVSRRARPGYGAEMEVFRGRMLEAGREREALNIRQRDWLKGMLDEAQYAQLPAWDFPHGIMPAPWDPQRLRAQREAMVREMREQSQRRIDSRRQE